MSYSNIIARLCFVAVCIFFSGCHSDDDPATSQAILTLQADTVYGGGPADDGWVFATDENGTLLDVKQYRAGQTVTLSPAARVDKINVTFFVHSSSGYFSFETWAAVPGGAMLHIEKVEPTSPPSADDNNTATFKVSNYPGTSEQFGISTGIFTGYSSFSGSGNLEATLSFSGAPADVLLYGYRSGELVYNWAKGVNSNDVITRDYGKDFAPFQHQTQLNFEGYNAFQIIGSAASRPFPVVVYSSTIESDGQPMIGYMDGFENYALSITNIKENGKTTYYQSGADLDLTFDIPAYTFSLNDNHIQNFSFDFSADYTYSASVWKLIDDQERSSAWTVYAPAGQSVKGISIPPEIATQYPQLSGTEFTYSYSTFTKVIKGWSYPDLVPGARTKEPDGTVDEGYVYAPKAN
jgi:hypothetical protein